MASNEYWEGYHSARKGIYTAEQAPYAKGSNQAKQWVRGFNQFNAESKR